MKDDKGKSASSGADMKQSSAAMTLQQRQERELKKQKLVAHRHQQLSLSEAMEYLTNGATFLKYGRRGRPKPRHVFLVEKAISWREPGSNEIPNAKKGNKSQRYMPILDFKEIKIGRDSDVFKRFKLKKEHELYREQLSFTIYAGKRTLDLEASTEIELNQFIKMLQAVWSFVEAEERANQGKTAIEEGQLDLIQNQQQREGAGGPGG